MASRKGGQIRFDVGFNVDKSSLNGLSQSLQNIAKQADSLGSSNGLDKQFKEAAAAASQLDSIIKESWNTKLNQLNLDKLNKGIKDSYGGVDQLKQKLYQAGEQGQRAFVDFSTQILNTNMQLKESSKLLDSMATSMANTVKWGITSGVFNSMTGAIQSAYGYAKNLDTSLNNIRIVTGDSADQMERFAEMANRSAKDLGRSTLDYTKAALSYYQQGLSQEDVRARTETTLKAQNITGIGSEMVDYLTAVWNGFQIGAEDAEATVDKLALVADRSASDMSQLAIAMSKVAATANMMGVDIDQLNAQIATVVAVTRQAPESVGTAFKTIYSRLNDIKTGADDAEISLGNYSGQMADLGFNVLDANGRLRDTGQVMEQIGSRWNTLSKEQQTYLAQIMGGTRQVTQITALFENWTTYSELLNASLNSQGALNEKNAIYMESLAAQLERLGAETERTYSILFDTKGYNSLVNIGTKALEIFNNFIDGLGGGANVLTYFGSLAVNIFSKQISQSILKTEQNLKSFLSNASKIKEQLVQTIQADAIANNTGLVDKRAIEEQANAAAKILAVQKGLTQEQYQATVELQKQIGLSKQKIINLEKEAALRTETLAKYREQTHLQDADVWTVQTKKELHQNLLDDLNAEIIALNKIEQASEDATLSDKQRNDLLDQMYSHFDAMNASYIKLKGTQEDFEASWAKIEKYILGESTQLEGWHDIETKLVQDRDQERNTLQQIDYILKNADINTANLTKQEKERLATLIKQNDVYAEQGQKVLNIQNLVKGLSVAGQLFSAATGVISTFMDETATGADKANAAFSGIQGTVSAIGSAFGPIGMGIATLANGALSLLKEIPAFGDWWEDLFTSAKEKVQQFNTVVSQAKNADLTSTKQIAELQDIQEEYNTLSEKAGQYGRNIDSLTNDEKNRYYELTDKFSQYNTAVIEGYDEQGHAIVKGQQALQGTIELLRTAKEEAIATSLGSIKDIDKNIQATWQNSDQYAGMQERKSQVQDKVNTTNSFINVPKAYARHTVQLPESLQALIDYQGELRDAFEQEEANLFSDLIADLQNGSLNDASAKQLATLIQNHQDAIIENLKAVSNLNTSDLHFDNQFLEVLQTYLGQYINATREFSKYSNIDLDAAYQQIEDTTEKIHYSGDALYAMLQTVTNSQYETSAAYQELRRGLSSSQESELQKLISDYIAQFTIDESKTKVRQATNEYIQELSAIFNNKDLFNAIETAVTENAEQLQKLTGTDYVNKIQTIIGDIVKDIKGFDKYSDVTKQALIDLLSNAFNLSDVKIEIGEDAEVKTDALEEKLHTQIANMRELIAEQTSHFGSTISFGPDFIDSVFNIEQLANPAAILNKIDWTKFAGLVQQGSARRDAFEQVVKEARQTKEEVEDIFSGISFDQILNNDDLIKNLTNKKKLSESEELYLTLLENESQSLRNIRDIQGRGSQEYIRTLQRVAEATRDRYRAEKQGAVQALEEQINLRQILLDNADEPTRAKLEEEINNLLLQQARLKYEISSIDQQQLELVKKLQTAETELAEKTYEHSLSETERNLNNLSSSGSALDALRSGQSLDTEQAAALVALEKEHTELAGIKNKYSLEYTNLLSQILCSERESNYQHQQENLLIEKTNRLKEIQATWETKILELRALRQAASVMDRDNTQQLLENVQQQATVQEQLLSLEEQRAELEAEIYAIETEISGGAADGITNMRVALDDFNDAINRLVEGQALSTDEWDHLNDILDEVLDKYPELQSQVELLHYEELAGTRQYAEAIQDVRNALETIRFEELFEEAEQAFSEIPTIEVGVDFDYEELESFQNELDDFLNIDRVIDIEVHSDAEEEFLRLEAEFDNLYDAAGMIGENFIVAADGLRELNNVFPGILEGMQLLDDGSYQLNANIVERSIATAQTVAMQDAASTIEQLQHQSDLLHQKSEIYAEMANAAYVLAGIETNASMTSAQAQSTISEGLAKVKDINSELSAKQQMSDDELTANSANENAKIVADDWAASAQSGAKSITTFANNAIKAFHAIAIASKAAAEGKIGGAFVPASAIASTYMGAAGKRFETTSSGESYRKITEDALSGNVSQERWKEIGDAFDALSKAAERQANDIDGMILQLAARGYDFSSGLGNVSRGQGIKGIDPSKSGSSKSGKTAKTPSSKKGSSAKTPKGTKEKTTKEKEENPDFMDYLEELPDRYHDINLIIKDLTKQLNALEKQQKKLFGKDLIDSLNQQIELLNQQIKAYQQKIVLAKIEKRELQDSLRQQGVLFDENTGAITNYAEVLTNRLNAVNAIIDIYNSLSQEEQKKYKDTVQQVKDDYEDFKKDISRYDEIIGEVIPDLQQSIRDARDEQIEKQISKFTMNVEINLDLSQAERDWNQFKKKVINQIRDDDILGNVRSRLEDFNSYYKQGEDAEISSLTRQVTRTAEQIQQINQYGTSVFYGNNKAQALEDLKKYSDQLMSSLQDVEDLINDVKQAFFDMVDAAEDAFQEQVKQYEFINKLIDHDKKLIELVYGDQAYDKMNNYYAKSRENDLKELDFQRQEKDFWWQQMQIEKARMEALSKESNEYKQAEERFKALEEQWMSAVESFNSKLEESIEHLLDEYKNNVSLIFQDLGKKLTDGKGLDYIGEEWELINMNADRYLDKINAMYALQQLENSYREAINNSNNNVKAQQSLNALMQQQLGMLAEREKISQYDVDRANMLLQVQIQRMALEEARNAKNKLRLRRDAQGNYSYQYTADEDNIAAASQNLAKAQADVYNLDRNKYRQNLDAIYQMQTDFNDKLQALYKEYPVWTEQAEAKKKTLVKQYEQAINGLTNENSIVRKNLQSSTIDSIKTLYNNNANDYAKIYGDTFLQLNGYYQSDIGNFASMTKADKDNFSNMATYINGLMAKIVPGWTGGIQSLSDKISKQGGFLPTMKDAFDKLNQNTEKYTKDLGKLETIAGTSFKKMSDGLDADIEKTKTAINDNEALIKKYEESFDTYKTLLSWLKAVTKGYDQIRQAAKNALTWTRALWNEEQKKASKAAEEDIKQTIEENPTPAPEPDVNPEPAPIPASDISTESVEDQPKARIGSHIKFRGVYYGNVQRGGGIGNLYAVDSPDAYTQGKQVEVYQYWDNNSEAAKWWSGEAVYRIRPVGGRDLGWIPESHITEIVQYDTGGYTGSWGSGGRMAMLHEKELVLNKNDTSNLLSAINIVKTLDSLLNNIGANTGITVPNLIAGTANATNNTQNVTIQASFPNATNRFEIEKAFENILNRASQYVATSRR